MKKRLILTREAGKKTSKVAAQEASSELHAEKRLKERDGENPHKAVDYS
jgi:hypothetical protein